MIFSENSLRVTSTLISLRNFELKQPATSHRHVQRRSSCHQAAHAQSTSRASQSLDSIFNVLSSGAAKLQRSFSSPSPGFPPGPRTDVALGLLQDPLAFLESTQQKYGDVVGVSLAGERAVIITDPQAAKTVLVDEPAAWVKAGTAFFPGSSLAGNGLLVSDGPIWRRQRQLATPAFRRAAVERYGASMVACTANALRSKRWRDGAVRDVYADFNELTLRITLNALFGADMGAAEALEVTESIRTAFEYFTRRAATGFAIPEAVPTPDNLQFLAAVRRLDTAVYGLINRRRAQMERPRTQPEEPSRQAAASTGAGSKDLLGALLESRDDEGRPMEDSALRDELMTLLVAGQETSAILLGWTCALLAQAPEVQEQAAAEVARVLGDRAPAPSDARGSLPILEAVVLEALRVMPPAYLVGRCAARDAHVAGYTLPAGTTVLVSPYVMQRDPRWWGPDAGIFRPDRWMTPDDAQSGGGSAPPLSAAQALSGMGPNGAYIPFGAGQRNCIGAGFAMMEAVLVMAAVLQRFRLVPLPGAGMAEAEPRITLRPKAVKLILRQRKKGKVGSMSGGGAQTGVGEPQPPTVRASWVQSAL